MQRSRTPREPLGRRRWLARAAGALVALAAGPVVAQRVPALAELPAASDMPRPPAPPEASAPTSPAAPAPVAARPAVRSRPGAPLRIGLPYTPSEEVVSLVDAQPTWMEVYGCPPAQVRALLQSLKRGEIPTTALAIGVIEALNLQIGGVETRLAQVEASLTRAGRPVLYDEQCRVRPRVGDMLQVRYASGELAVALTARLVSAVSLGLAHPFAEELTELDTARPEHCKAEVEQRLYYAGRLELFERGRRVDARDVLVQTIAEL